MQPLLYHAHHTQYLEDLPFWLDLAGQSGSPILELGCGTGRIMLPLIDAGFQVTGLDLSAEMLAQLQALAEQAGIAAPRLIQADLTNFRLDCQFPLIILPCNTYSTLNRSQRKSTLTCICRHLEMGGKFVTSLPNPEWLINLEAIEEIEVETVFIHPLSSNPVQASNEWRRSADQLEICWHYDHLLPNGEVERFSMSTSHYLTLTDTYLEELTQSGFKLSTYGDFDRKPFSPEQPFLIITASLA